VLLMKMRTYLAPMGGGRVAVSGMVSYSVELDSISNSANGFLRFAFFSGSSLVDITIVNGESTRGLLGGAAGLIGLRVSDLLAPGLLMLDLTIRVDDNALSSRSVNRLETVVDGEGRISFPRPWAQQDWSASSLDAAPESSLSFLESAL
jgi:hypothetical protein